MYAVTMSEDGSWKMPVSFLAQDDQESQKPNEDTQPGSKRTFVPSAGAVPYAALKEQSPQRFGWRAEPGWRADPVATEEVVK